MPDAGQTKSRRSERATAVGVRRRGDQPRFQTLSTALPSLRTKVTFTVG